MKKKLVLSIFVFLILFTSTYAQTSNLKSAETENWKEFTAEDKSFKILFPSQTEADKKQADNLKTLLKQQGQGGDLNSQTSFSGNIIYSIRFSDAPSAPFDEMDRNVEYELMLTKLARKTKDVYAQKHPGVETEVEIKQAGADYKTIFRLFIIQQRKFVLSVLIPSLEKFSPAQRKIYRAKVDKFFNSFAVLDIPPAKYEPIPLLLKNFKVSLNGKNFRSDTLGLSIQLPTDWTAEIHQPNRMPTEEEKKSSLPLRWFWRNRERLIEAKSPIDNVGFWININRRESADDTLQSFTASMAAFAGSDLFFNTKTLPPVKPITINGREFLMFEQFDKETQIWEEHYFTDLDKSVLEIRTKYKQKSDKKIIEDSLNTLKFQK